MGEGTSFASDDVDGQWTVPGADGRVRPFFFIFTAHSKLTWVVMKIAEKRVVVVAAFGIRDWFS